MAKLSYGLDSLKDVRVDIWGDGMQRGNQDVTRLCFRILGAPGKTRHDFKAHSRNHVFTFAVFYGKVTFSLVYNFFAVILSIILFLI